MISFPSALKLIADSTLNFRQKTEIIPSSLAINRICAVDIVSPVEAPAFNNSAMDGYAISLAALKNLCNRKDLSFYIIKTIRAGDKIDSKLSFDLEKNVDLKSELCFPCVKIMTGAYIPVDFDTVIRKEDCIEVKSSQGTCSNFDKISIVKLPPIGSNIRKVGEDFKKNELLLEAYSLIGADQIMILAAAGISKLEVLKKTPIAIINTGSEIEPDFQPNIKAGKIRNINGPYLKAKLALQDVELKDYSIVHDIKDKFTAKIKSLLAKNIELIISTGAVSAGDFDFIPEALKELNAKIIFYKVAIRPGYPIIFAYIPKTNILKPSSVNGSYFFGLPGNPISTAVCYKFFVCEFLNKIKKSEKIIKNYAKLRNPIEGKSGYTSFKKCFCSLDKTGKLWAEILSDQSSASTKNTIKSNCWAKLLPNNSKYQKNDVIEVYNKI